MNRIATRPTADLPKSMTSFDSDAKCRAYLETLRWPDGVKCPRCQATSISRIRARKVFGCEGCRYQFSVTAGTLFHDSHLPLPKWFLAISLMSASKEGMSALQLKRRLKVSYKTAWYLCHRIREAMKTDDNAALSVEATVMSRDSRRRISRKGHEPRKAMILAGLQRRGGNLRVSTDHGNVTRTDVVSHLEQNHTRTTIQAHTIEGAFRLFKRAIVGSYHQISVKHIDRYLDEFEYRYNNRKNAYLLRDMLLRIIAAKAMPYGRLIA